MYLRDETGAEHSDDRPGGEHFHLSRRGYPRRGAIAKESPSPELAAPQQVRTPSVRDEGSRRQRRKARAIRLLEPVAPHAFGVQLPVDLVGSRGVTGERSRFEPDGTELLVPVPATLRAGPVAFDELRRLIEEEQLRVATGRQDLSAYSLEARTTGDPADDSPVGDDLSSRIVENASVSHPGAPRARRMQAAIRVDTIL